MPQFYKRRIWALIALLALSACALPTVAPRKTNAAAGVSTVQLLVLPDDDETTLFAAISGARSRVWMSMYFITEPRLFDALAAARRNNADVRAMIEPNVPGNAVTNNREAVEKIQALGGSARQPNPAFRLTHSKSFVIDDLLVISTANMTRAAMRDNREFVLLIREPALVAEAAIAFDADWSRTKFDLAEPRLVWSPLNARASWQQLIAGARQTVDIYAEVALDKGIARDLGTAVERGVRVRMLLPPPEGSSTREDGGPAGFQRSGINLRSLGKPYAHAKAIVVDGERAYIGSTNISTASLDFNRELGAIVTDRAAVARVAATFERDWATAVSR